MLRLAQPLPTLPAGPALLLSVLSVQGGAAIAKGVFPVVGAIGTTGLRIGLSALLLCLVFRPSLRQLTPEQWRAVLPYGMVLGSMNLLFYLALARIPLGLAVTLEFVGPLLLAVVGSRRALDVVWVALAGAGVAMITPWSGQGTDGVGMLVALLAGACWAGYVVLGSRVSQVLPSGTGVAVGMGIATLTALPFVGLSGDWDHLTSGLVLAGAALAVLSSAVPFTLELVALRSLPLRTFSVLLSLEPAVAALCGTLFLHEVLSVGQWTAVVLVAVASGATAWTAPGVRIDSPAP
ncbi:EamA family transporter [Deinococcus hopiensis]|uniref:Inner membrane transporter RhtA n=1 Tax=Deinococcus hopiensis KR-140 TaxID=695939 RepID=A0A1W1UTW5_9DEIO|nr:DMT family transporter [Deinococcus hopiensis]SMB84575.1 inner membrane transporter RhtA [Deinococcus hopiensis KR-140]